MKTAELTYRIEGGRVSFYRGGRSLSYVPVAHFAPGIGGLLLTCWMAWNGTSTEEVRAALSIARDELIDLGIIND